jgi:hypothetical protein
MYNSVSIFNRLNEAQRKGLPKPDIGRAENRTKSSKISNQGLTQSFLNTRILLWDTLTAIPIYQVLGIYAILVLNLKR